MNRIFYAVLVVLFTITTQPATAGFKSQISNVNQGNIFTIDIVGGDLFPEARGGGVDLFYDKGIINVLSVSVNAWATQIEVL